MHAAGIAVPPHSLHTQQKRLQKKIHCSQTFSPVSQFFLRVRRNCAPTHSTGLDAHMHGRPFAPPLAAVITVALATIILGACGPADTSSPTTAAANAPVTRAALPPASASTDTVANGLGISNPDTANAAVFASDAVQSAQASLAADSQQIAPVLSYAPGDGPPQQTTASNNSSSTATTSQ
jgi:hypothetical protein